MKRFLFQTAPIIGYFVLLLGWIAVNRPLTSFLGLEYDGTADWMVYLTGITVLGVAFLWADGRAHRQEE
jgi:hypothetical protein